jgi:CRP/FNR family transcriptional regulator, cyclic AMP receptor protein
MTREPGAVPVVRGRLDAWHGQATVLDRLEEPVRATLDSLAGSQAFAAGDVILREGGLTPFLAVVERGRVGLRLLVPERGPQTVVTVEPGELLGWSAVVPPYRATSEAVAIEDTTLRTFEAEALRQLLRDDAAVALGILPIVLDTVSVRLATSWQQLLDLFAGRGAEPW